ncbi:MAG: hypothetical protein NZM38_01135 [Cytophagales bacterium]|nr:hypothetical protein [Cytophagales bacterium]MDW8383353.1 hypothetical protein [Flammeovirgaceae bacterium]
MKNYRIVQLAFLVFSFGFWGCKKEKSENPKPLVPFKYQNGVYILYQGPFGSGSGSLDFYSFTGDSLIRDLFGKIGKTIGTAAWDMAIGGTKMAITVSMSKQLKIVDLVTFSNVDSVTNLENPRYVAISGEKAYVSDWGEYDAAFNSPSPKIRVINLNSKTIVKNFLLPFNMRPEGIINANGKIYVALQGNIYGTTVGTKIYVINPNTDVISDSITVGGYPSLFAIDARNRLLVTCQKDSAIYRIKLSDNTVENKVQAPTKLSLNGSIATGGNDTYVILQSGVARFGLDATTISSSLLISGNSFEAIGFDSRNRRIFISDNGYFLNNGKVMIYNIDGSLIKEWGASVATPRAFLMQ